MIPSVSGLMIRDLVLVLRDYDTEIHDSADWFLPGSGLVLPVRDWYAACDSLHLDQDQVETLVGLAAEGRSRDFRDLAAMLGVSPDRIDALWTGTVRRLPGRTAPPPAT